MNAKTSKMINLNDMDYHIWRNKMNDLLFMVKSYLPIFATTKYGGKTIEDIDRVKKNNPNFDGDLNLKVVPQKLEMLMKLIRLWAMQMLLLRFHRR